MPHLGRIIWGRESHRTMHYPHIVVQTPTFQTRRRRRQLRERVICWSDCCAALICHRMDEADENQTPDLWQLHIKKGHHDFSQSNQSKDNWKSIFSSKSRAGSKYFYWIFPFNDMQQMWNEARGERHGNHFTDWLCHRQYESCERQEQTFK